MRESSSRKDRTVATAWKGEQLLVYDFLRGAQGECIASGARLRNWPIWPRVAAATYSEELCLNRGRSRKAGRNDAWPHIQRSLDGL